MSSVHSGDADNMVLGHYNAKYMGGHTEYPTPRWTGVFIYEDKIILQSLGLQIPYSSMVKIQNANKEEIAGFLFVGPIGTWWKKNHRYTVIQYKNDIDTQTIVIDFEKGIDSAQPLIYRRMIRFQQIRKANRPRDGLLVYENAVYGISMQYPINWIEDETKEQQRDFIALVEFRSSIENQAPFVTIFINSLAKKDVSLREFVDKEMDDLRNDSLGFNQEEFSNTVLGDYPAIKLLYSDEKSIIDKPEGVYTELIIWTKVSDKVYEIRYSVKKPDYLKYLPQVMQMINSFQIIGKVGETPMEIDTVQEKMTTDVENPIVILKRRFARGEITEQEYERMRKIIQG